MTPTPNQHIVLEIMYFVYILKSKKDNNLYTGFTNDLRRRFSEHNSGKSFATKYRGPFELIYYEAYKSEIDAKNREEKIKIYGQGYRRLKERLKNSLK